LRPATSNLRIKSLESLVPPARLMALLPLDPPAAATIVEGRRAVERVLGEDPRVVAVVGPCSIHDLDAAREYAARLKQLADRVADRLLVVMRVYFEKPRTTVGWKGLINDPHIDDSFDVATGLRMARGLLIEVAASGSSATEFSSRSRRNISPIRSCSAAIGARTTESPTHRQMASGLSMPVGLQELNRRLAPSGGRRDAVGPRAAQLPRHRQRRRHGRRLHHGQSLGRAHAPRRPQRVELLAGRHGGGPHEAREGRPPGPDHRRLQPRQFRQGSAAAVDRVGDVLAQRLAGDRSIVGLMLESNIHPGSQPASSDRSQLQYGVSITDACIGWEETQELLLEAHATLA